MSLLAICCYKYVYACFFTSFFRILWSRPHKKAYLYAGGAEDLSKATSRTTRTDVGGATHAKTSSQPTLLGTTAQFRVQTPLHVPFVAEWRWTKTIFGICEICIRTWTQVNTGAEVKVRRNATDGCRRRDRYSVIVLIFLCHFVQYCNVIRPRFTCCISFSLIYVEQSRRSREASQCQNCTQKSPKAFQSGGADLPEKAKNINVPKDKLSRVRGKFYVILLCTLLFNTTFIL